MPAFRYEAVDALGAASQGVVNADSARAARAELRTQNLVPISVAAIAPPQLDAAGQAKRGAFGDRLSTLELALFTRQLASLLEAGLPLDLKTRVRFPSASTLIPTRSALPVAALKIATLDW